MLVQEYIAGLLRTSPPEQWKSLTKRNANEPGENKLVTQSDEDETEDQGDDSVIENDQQSLRSEDTQNSDSEAEYRWHYVESWRINLAVNETKIR